MFDQTRASAFIKQLWSLSVVADLPWTYIVKTTLRNKDKLYAV